MPELNATEAEVLLAGIVIPPRPDVVEAIKQERRKEDPDLRRVAALVAGDVGISAAVLKTVNSPLYGLRRQVASIDQAVSLLGMGNIDTLVTGLALRQMVPADGLARFWDAAARMALVCAHLTKVTGLGQRENAYLFGLFHDCGIPLLVARFPAYKDVLRQANSQAQEGFTRIEEQQVNTNHALVGSLLAANWNLPQELRDAIRHHHDLDVFESPMLTADAVNLIALGHLGEHLETLYSQRAPDSEWDRFAERVFSHLMMSRAEFDDLSVEVKELLAESGL